MTKKNPEIFIIYLFIFKMVEIDCGNVCDTSGRESNKVKEGRYKIDELTKDVDCDVLFESSYLDGVYPKTIGRVLIKF